MIGEAGKGKNVKQGDEISSSNSKEDIPKSSSTNCSKMRNSSFKKQRGDHIRPFLKVNEWKPTARSTEKDRSTPHYSTNELKMVSGEMDDVQNAS